MANQSNPSNKVNPNTPGEGYVDIGTQPGYKPTPVVPDKPTPSAPDAPQPSVPDGPSGPVQTGPSAADIAAAEAARRALQEKIRNETLRQKNEQGRREAQQEKSANANKAKTPAAKASTMDAPKPLMRAGDVIEDGALKPATQEKPERDPGTGQNRSKTLNPYSVDQTGKTVQEPVSQEMRAAGNKMKASKKAARAKEAVDGKGATKAAKSNNAPVLVDTQTGEVVDEVSEDVRRPIRPDALLNTPKKDRKGLGPQGRGIIGSMPDSRSEAVGALIPEHSPSDQEVEEAQAQTDYSASRQEQAADGGDGGKQPPTSPSEPADDAPFDDGPVPPRAASDREAKRGNDWEPLKERPTEKRDAAIARIVNDLRNGSVRVTGVKYDKEGNIVKGDRKLGAALDEGRRFFGLRDDENHILYKSVYFYYGISKDRAGELFGDKNGAINGQIVIDAIHGMMRNVERTGYPFVHTTKDQFAGSQRFCIPIVTDEIAVALTNKNSRVKHSARELMDFGIEEYQTRVKPAIDLVASQDQKIVLMDMLDAVEHVNGTHKNYAHRLPDSDFTLHEAVNELAGWANIYEDPEQLAEANRKMEERLLKYSQEAMRKGKREIRDKNGNLLRVSDARLNTAQWVLKMFTKAARATALQNPVLGLTAIPEHVLGNVEHKFADGLLRLAYKTQSVTDATYQLANDQVVKDVLNDAAGMMASGKREDLMMYLDGGGKLGDGRATKTMRQEMSEATGGEKFKIAVEHGMDKYAAFGNAIASGRWFMQSADAKRFLQHLYFNIQRNEGNTMTPEQFEKMLAADPAAFIEEYLKRPEGQDALLFMMDNTVGNVNVLSETIVKLNGKNPVTDFLIAVFVSKFLTYGINFTGKIMPLSHTANYLVAHQLSKGGNKNQWQDLAIGGNRSFKEGVMQNLVIDLATFGTRAGVMCLAFGIMAILGVDFGDDDDDENEDYMDEAKSGVYGEVKIGGVRLKENWMLRDLLGFAMPGALAAHAALQGKDPWLAFQGGALEVVTSTPWVKFSSIADGVINFDRNLIAAQEEEWDRWGDEKPTDLEFMQVKMQTYGLSLFANFVEHPIMRIAYGEAGNLSRNNLVASTTRIYMDEEGNTTKTTWSDAQWRALGRRSWLAGTILNWVNGVHEENPGVVKTSYTKDGMPLVEIYDPAQSYWLEKWEFADDISEEDKLAKCDEIITVARMYDSPAEIAADGIIIPYEARQHTVDYLQAQINALYNEFNLNKATPGYYTMNGLSKDENYLNRERDYDIMNKQVQELKQIQQRIWDNRIPYTPTKYNQWETDWRTMYSNAEGQPIGPVDAAIANIGGFFTGKDSGVTSERYASGDHKSSILPFLAVDDRYGTYDAQTPSAWWNPALSDMDKLKELYGDAVLTEGMHAGKNVYDMLSGGGVLKSGDQSLTGQRSLIPVPVNYDDQPKLKAGDRDDAWNPLGEMGVKDAFKTDPSSYSSSYGSYGGYRRSYGSGGGKGYNPSIYSHAAYSLQTDKPATMYAKVPYEARYDYLRPGFETKGSREAYKRQDF